MKNLWLAIAAILVFVNPATAREPLELQTQFGKTVPILGDGQPRIIVYADQEGSDQTASWSEALQSNPCPALAVADLSAVPEFARSMVRESFRNEEPIAFDWDGELAARLGFEENQANAYLIGSEGQTLAHFSGEPTPEATSELNELGRASCATRQEAGSSGQS